MAFLGLGSWCYEYHYFQSYTPYTPPGYGTAIITFVEWKFMIIMVRAIGCNVNMNAMHLCK